MLILGHADVVELLPMKACLGVMADALAALARGEAHSPLRTSLRPPHAGASLLLMPAYAPPAALAVKVISTTTAAHGSSGRSHPGVVLLFDAGSGDLRAILDASAITAIRTAAVSGVATDRLARGDASSLAILGSGVQARSHLEAMLLVRPASRVRLWSRTAERARAFAEREGARHGLTIEVAPSAREAVAGADILCTTTSATEPILQGEWVTPGAHINAIGAYTPTTREVDTATVARSSLFVDSREAALSEAGDFLLAAAEAGLTPQHIRAELAEVLIGRHPGRRSDDEVTLFKSLGLGVEDAAAAAYVFERAIETDRGVRLELS